MVRKPGIVSYAIVEKDFGLAKPAKILKSELACGAERIVSRDIALFLFVSVSVLFFYITRLPYCLSVVALSRGPAAASGNTAV